MSQVRILLPQPITLAVASNGHRVRLGGARQRKSPAAYSGVDSDEQEDLWTRRSGYRLRDSILSDGMGWVMPEALIFPLYVTLFIGGLIAFAIWWG